MAKAKKQSAKVAEKFDCGKFAMAAEASGTPDHKKVGFFMNLVILHNSSSFSTPKRIYFAVNPPPNRRFSAINDHSRALLIHAK